MLRNERSALNVRFGSMSRPKLTDALYLLVPSKADIARKFEEYVDYTLLEIACVAPPNRGGLNSTHIHGTSVPVEEPSTASTADSYARRPRVRPDRHLAISD